MYIEVDIEYDPDTERTVLIFTSFDANDIVLGLIERVSTFHSILNLVANSLRNTKGELSLFQTAGNLRKTTELRFKVDMLNRIHKILNEYVQCIGIYCEKLSLKLTYYTPILNGD